MWPGRWNTLGDLSQPRCLPGIGDGSIPLQQHSWQWEWMVSWGKHERRVPGGGEIKARLQSTLKAEQGHTFHHNRQELGSMGAVAEGSIIWVEGDVGALSWLFHCVNETWAKSSLRGVWELFCVRSHTGCWQWKDKQDKVLALWQLLIWWENPRTQGSIKEGVWMAAPMFLIRWQHPHFLIENNPFLILRLYPLPPGTDTWFSSAQIDLGRILGLIQGWIDGFVQASKNQPWDFLLLLKIF